MSAPGPFNVSSYLRRAAQRHPQQRALCENERCIATFAELEARVQELADYLRVRLGLCAGDRVALFAENRARYIEWMLALWRAGAIVVPVNARLHVREAAYILADSQARLCLTESHRTGALAAAVRDAGLPPDALAVGDIDVDPEVWPALGGTADKAVAADEVAWLFYTSGTTGKPKGVQITHENLRQMVLNYLADIEPVAPGQCLLHFAPLSHGSGLYLLAHLAGGSNNVVVRGLDLGFGQIARLAAQHGAASLFVAPTMIQRLLRSPEPVPTPGQLRTVIFGGGPMHVAPLKDAAAALGDRLVQIYGQGESPMTITCMRRSELQDAIACDDHARLASVGSAFVGVEVGVRTADGIRLSPGEAGEIVVRGATVMAGYWNQPDATRQALRDGWLHTGDIGVLGGTGDLTLLDRSKDMIISGGMNIYSREIEDVLVAHPGVREAAVIGLDDAQWGEIVVACVATVDGKAVDACELDRHCLDHLARFKRPKRYHFFDELPKNHYGKVLKRELKARLCADAPAAPA